MVAHFFELKVATFLKHGPKVNVVANEIIYKKQKKNKPKYRENR